MYLYTVAYVVMRGVHIKFGAVLIWADNHAESIGYAHAYTSEQYPSIEGWSSASLQSFKIEDSIIDRAYHQNHPGQVTIRLNSKDIEN